MRLTTILGAGAMAAVIAVGAARPATADEQTTQTIILGAAAVVTGVAIEANVARKARLANTIVGYTPYGAAVYADNHVVLPNGYSYYPNNVGQTIACNGGACTINGAGPSNTGYAYGGYDSR